MRMGVPPIWLPDHPIMLHVERGWNLLDREQCSQVLAPELLEAMASGLAGRIGYPDGHGPTGPHRAVRRQALRGCCA